MAPIGKHVKYVTQCNRVALWRRMLYDIHISRDESHENSFSLDGLLARGGVRRSDARSFDGKLR